MRIGDNASVKIIYFSDEKATRQRLVFDGSAKQLKEEQFGYDWEGFELGDRFHIEDEEVRVYSINDHFDAGEVVYIVGPNGLNHYKIDYKNIRA